jgi:hypothetical protein
MARRGGHRFGRRAIVAPQNAGIADYGAATFTRASSASFLDPRSNRFVGPERGTNLSRLFADGAILIEGARTNEIGRSEDLSAWTNSGCVLTGAQAAPDGQSDAYIVQDDSAAAIESISLATAVLASSTAFVASYWVKKDAVGSRFPEIQHTSGGNTAHVQINTVDGTVATRLVAGFTSVSASSVDAGDWWIVVLKFTTPVGMGALTVSILPAGGATLGAAPANANLGSVTIWGAQIEAGTFRSTYIRSEGGAAATRAAESCIFAAQPFDPNPNFVTDFWPEFSNAEDTASRMLFSWQRAGAFGGDWLAIDNARAWVRSNTAGSDVFGVTFAARQKCTFEARKGSDQLVLTGFSTGNGTHTLSTATADWPTSGQVAVGSTSGIAHAFGVISRPRRP